MLNNFSNGEKTLVIIGLIPILIVFIMIKGWFIACLWNWLCQQSLDLLQLLLSKE